MAVTFTPGPWVIKESWMDGPLVDVRAVDGFTVCGCGRPDEDNATANARLIAAAPELYDFVKQSEWVAADELGAQYCHVCQLYKHSGHAIDCELNALLKRLDVIAGKAV